MFPSSGHHVFPRSPEAFSLGVRLMPKGPGAALPYLQRAIELDPNFAMGYPASAAITSAWVRGALASTYTKAFELREHASEREKLASLPATTRM